MTFLISYLDADPQIKSQICIAANSGERLPRKSICNMEQIKEFKESLFPKIKKKNT
jgi:hypothetical protein